MNMDNYKALHYEVDICCNIFHVLSRQSKNKITKQIENETSTSKLDIHSKNERIYLSVLFSLFYE